MISPFNPFAFTSFLMTASRSFIDTFVSKISRTVSDTFVILRGVLVASAMVSVVSFFTVFLTVSFLVAFFGSFAASAFPSAASVCKVFSVVGFTSFAGAAVFTTVSAVFAASAACCFALAIFFMVHLFILFTPLCDISNKLPCFLRSVKFKFEKTAALGLYTAEHRKDFFRIPDLRNRVGGICFF